MTKKEIDQELKFVKYAESRGCEALKLRIDGRNGFPDRTVITPNGILFLEFKLPGGNLSYQQKAWISRLRSFGHRAEVVFSANEAMDVLDDLIGVGP